MLKQKIIICDEFSTKKDGCRFFLGKLENRYYLEEKFVFCFFFYLVNSQHNKKKLYPLIFFFYFSLFETRKIFEEFLYSDINDIILLFLENYISNEKYETRFI